MTQEKFNDIPIADLNAFDYPTGKILFSSTSGKTQCWIDERGKLIINMPALRSLGIMDITNLKSHQIWRNGRLNFHEIIFFDNSFLEITFDDAGQIHYSNCSGISTKINGDGEMIIYKNNANPNA